MKHDWGVGRRGWNPVEWDAVPKVRGDPAGQNGEDK